MGYPALRAASTTKAHSAGQPGSLSKHTLRTARPAHAHSCGEIGPPVLACTEEQEGRRGMYGMVWWIERKLGMAALKICGGGGGVGGPLLF